MPNGSDSGGANISSTRAPGNCACSGSAPSDQLRLPARAGLGLDPQRPAAVLDVAVHPAHHVALQRRQHRLAVALEHERPRLVQPVDQRLAEAPAERPAHQPLQLHPARLADRQVVGQTGVGLVGALTRARSSSETLSSRRSRTDTARLSSPSHSRGWRSAARDT